MHSKAFLRVLEITQGLRAGKFQVLILAGIPTYLTVETESSSHEHFVSIEDYHKEENHLALVKEDVKAFSQRRKVFATRQVSARSHSYRSADSSGKGYP